MPNANNSDFLILNTLAWIGQLVHVSQLQPVFILIDSLVEVYFQFFIWDD